jgi:hypothetical protein
VPVRPAGGPSRSAARHPQREPGSTDLPAARTGRALSAGGAFLVCPICFNAKGLDESQLIKSAELGGTAPMWRWIGDGATTFSY